MDVVKQITEKLEEQKGKILEKIEEKTTAIENANTEKTIALDTEIKELKDELSLVKNMIEKKGNSSSVSLPGVSDEKEKFSFVKAMNYIGMGSATGQWTHAEKVCDAGFEVEVFKNAREKAQNINTGSGGGFLVPTEISSELIEILLAKTVVAEAGATVMTGLTGSPFEIPTQETDITAYIVGENNSITESDATFGQKVLTPRSFAALVKLSKKSATMTNPNLEAWVRDRMAKKIALRMDLACLRGNGVGVEPLGIVNTSGINTVAIGTNGGRFTFKTAQDVVTELENDNIDIDSAAFVSHPKVLNRMKNERIAQFSADTGGAYVILPMTDQMLRDSLGYPFFKTTQLPTNLTKGSGTNLSEVIFGSWEDIWIGMWGSIELMASEHTSDAFAKNQIWVRAIQESDCVVARPTSFCLVNDATTQD